MKEFSISIKVELFFLRQVVLTLINSILFHRSFSEAVPKDVLVLNKITTVQLDDPQLQSQIESRIDAFMATLNSQSTYILSFALYEKLLATQKRGWFGLESKEEEKIEIERWNINISIVPSSDEATVVDQVNSALFYITKTSIDFKDHIPAITNTDRYPFPFQILFSNDASGVWKLPFL